MKIPYRFSLQTKLIVSLFTVIVLTGIGSLIVGFTTINTSIVNGAHEHVVQTLEMYSEMYNSKLYVKHRLMNAVASFSVFQRDVEEGNKTRIFQVIKEILKETQFDILNVTDETGRILVRSQNMAVGGDFVTNDIYVKQAIKTKMAVYGFDVMEQNDLRRESEDLAKRALIQVIPTARSIDSNKKVETRGMFLKAATPIFNHGKLVGVIYGAVLLNNDFSIPDRTKSLVFGDEQVDGRDIGTATLFLEDLRISTNVRDKLGQRAIGTLVSGEVYKEVFEGGKVWKSKAFVLDRWYIAAYKPVKNIENKTIGIIYTGLLQAKYSKIKQSAMLSFLVMILVTSLIAILLASYIVHMFIQPITALEDAAGKIIDGKYPKVNITSKDEMGTLGYVFNNMVDALIEKDRRLMEHVEAQIQQTEKLASLGRLSSGIAHEINNPLTGVLTYSSILLEELAGSEHEADLRVIVQETLRCRDIVKGMLDFARESKMEKVFVNLNKIIIDSLVILEKHISFHDVKIVRDLDPELPELFIDINQMKSVINNLAVNAADAMPNGGTLTISTKTSADRNHALMVVGDTGVGIEEENLLKVFDPFFSTKETGKGTGLGLSVTYGVVKRHNGWININSKVGVGTTVEVSIPLPDREETT